jgi:hypothetical protein
MEATLAPLHVGTNTEIIYGNRSFKYMQVFVFGRMYNNNNNNNNNNNTCAEIFIYFLVWQ